MFVDLFLSYIHGLISDLGVDFYEKSITDRKMYCKNNFSDEELSDFLMKSESYSDLLNYVKKTLLNLEEDYLFSKEENILLKSYFNFITKEVIPVFDKISVRFYIASKEDKELLLEKVFTNDGLFFKSFCSFLTIASSEEAQDLFVSLAQKVKGGNRIITIQSARECNPALKSEIRSHFGEDHFVVFQVNTRLLGGMLIYKNGEIVDSSWLGKVNALKHIKY